MSDYVVYGLSTKHDSGNIRVWGSFLTFGLTDWAILYGPIIGFDFPGTRISLSIIVGDECKPKYFGSKILSVKLGERRIVQFYW